MAAINPANTALLLIGFQNDYFSPDGKLYPMVAEQLNSAGALENTLSVIEAYRDTEMLMIQTPIVFNLEDGTLDEPVGILKQIREVRAFEAGTQGAKTIDALTALGDRIDEVPGKIGFNAFTNTRLEEVLRARGVKSLLIAGCVTPLCINATALHASEHGFEVTILSDCTSSRTSVEQQFFCESVFPLFSQVLTSQELLDASTST